MYIEFEYFNLFSCPIFHDQTHILVWSCYFLYEQIIEIVGNKYFGVAS